MSRKTNRNKDPERRAVPFKNGMNPVRKMLVDKLGIALAAHHQREDAGDFKHYDQAIEFNQEFVERSRGKGGKKRPHGKTYVKSVALQKNAIIASD